MSNDEVMEVDNSAVTKASSEFVTFDCPENHCVMQFRREDRLHAHLLLGLHKTIIPSFRLFDKAIAMYKDGLESDKPKQVPNLPVNSTVASSVIPVNEQLGEGWALFCARSRVAFTSNQRSYLEERYAEGEKSGSKWDANSVAEARKILRQMRSVYHFCTIYLEHAVLEDQRSISI